MESKAIKANIDEHRKAVVSSSQFDSFNAIFRIFNKIHLAVAASLFICQVGSAACLCRPIVVLAGILVSLLFLAGGVLGNYVAGTGFSPVLLLGHACLSTIMASVGAAATLSLLSGQFAVACVSVFHDSDQRTTTQLRIVECLSLVASVPCLGGAICALLTAVISARASFVPNKTKHNPKLFLCLQGDDTKSTSITKGMSPGSPPPSTPPPSYYSEESFA